MPGALKNEIMSPILADVVCKGPISESSTGDTSAVPRTGNSVAASSNWKSVSRTMRALVPNSADRDTTSCFGETPGRVLALLFSDMSLQFAA